MAKHTQVRLGAGDELIVWVIIVEVLVFGTYGLAKLIEAVL